MTGRKKGEGHHHHHHHAHEHPHGINREDTHGAKTMETLSRISQKKQSEDIKRSLEFGLEAAGGVHTMFLKRGRSGRRLTTTPSRSARMYGIRHVPRDRPVFHPVHHKTIPHVCPCQSIVGD